MNDEKINEQVEEIKLEEIVNEEEVVVKKVKYKSQKRAKLISTIIAYILLVVLSVIWLYPILWIILSAFREEYNETGTLITAVQGNYFPKSFGFENFRILFTNENYPFLKWFMNTLIIAVCSCVLSTILVLSVAYCMSKLRFKMRKPFMNISMILGLFPGFMSMTAIYAILKIMHLDGTLAALILVYSAGAGIGFQIAKGFFDIIPNSLVESARLDGCTNFQIFYRIILPLSKPIIIYTALMAFTGPWMDFIFARIILGNMNRDMWTVAVGLNDLAGRKEGAIGFTTFAAGSVCIAVPIVILFMCLQRYYVEGVTSGAVKG